MDGNAIDTIWKFDGRNEKYNIYRRMPKLGINNNQSEYNANTVYPMSILPSNNYGYNKQQVAARTENIIQEDFANIESSNTEVVENAVNNPFGNVSKPVASDIVTVEGKPTIDLSEQNNC